MFVLILAAALVSSAPGVVSVVDFGAIGDGKADDTCAFRRAVATGKVVTVPPPPVAYQLTGTVVLQNSVLGLGTPRIIMSGGSGDGTHSMFQVGPLPRPIRIADLSLDGGWDGRSETKEFDHLVELFAATGVSIEDCELRNPKGDCVFIGHDYQHNDRGYFSRNVVVRDCAIANPYRCAVAVVSGVGIKIRDNTILKPNAYVAAIGLEKDDNPTADNFRVEDVAIEGNEFDAPAVAFVSLLSPRKSGFKRVRIRSNSGQGHRGVLVQKGASPVDFLEVRQNLFHGDVGWSKFLEVNPGSVDILRVHDNIDTAVSAKNPELSFWYIEGVDRAEISGNRIAGDRVTGLVLQDVTNARVRDNTITLESHGLSAINLSGTAGTTGVRLSGNTLSSPYFVVHLDGSAHKDMVLDGNTMNGVYGVFAEAAANGTASTVLATNVCKCTRAVMQGTFKTSTILMPQYEAGSSAASMPAMRMIRP